MHLVVIFGPPAAGKMTVGQEVARRTGYKLFHNHMSIDPVLDIFEFGTAPFERLTHLLRREVIAEAVTADLPGLVFTVAWALDRGTQTSKIRELVAPVVEAGDPVDFVELVVDEETCIAREGTPNRLQHKRTKHDVDRSVALTRELHADHVFRTNGDFPLPHPHHVVDNSGDSPADTAERVIDVLGLDLPTSRHG